MSEMNGNDPAPAGVKIEDVMQDVRRTIMQRQLPGQVQLPEATRNLPTEYYEHLARARLAQSKLEVDLLVTPSPVPLVGPFIDGLRRKVHELVMFYVNRFAANQGRVNSHLMQALTVLGEPTESDPDAPRMIRRAGYTIAADSDRATADDVYTCYYLLLGRVPDMDDPGWHYWTSLVDSNDIKRGYLVDSFMTSPEFRSKQAERNTPILVELPGFQMYVRLNDNFIGAGIARDHGYEAHVTRVISDLLSPGYTFIDVGANIGYFSMLAASLVGSEGRVVAFEPSPANCDLVRRSIAANQFAGRVTLHQAAVADQRSQLQYYSTGIDSNGRIIMPGELIYATEAQTVEAVTLDETVNGLERIDVIKLDIEGAEALAWRGMRAIIARHRPALVFEFSPEQLQRTSGVAPADFLAELEKFYQLHIIALDGKISPRPDDIPAIMERHVALNQSHIDVLARPRR